MFNYCIRGLLFIYLFLENVVKGEQDLVKCCYTAYEDSLKRYHNWFVRGIVTVSNNVVITTG